jgi:hypothetical protein
VFSNCPKARTIISMKQDWPNLYLVVPMMFWEYEERRHTYINRRYLVLLPLNHTWHNYGDRLFEVAYLTWRDLLFFDPESE